jgi:hypothetical protein
VLGEEVWVVSKGAMKNKVGEGLVTYLPGELMHLIRLRATPEEIKKIHLVKETFPGSKIVRH